MLQKTVWPKSKVIILIFVILIILFGLEIGIREIGRYLIPRSFKYEAARELKVNRNLQMEIFFNDPLNKPIFTDLVIKAIDAAKRRVDIAIYSIDSEKIRDRLYAAVEKGISVSIVLDIKNREKNARFFENKPKNLQLVEVPLTEDKNQEYSSMHDKFIIVDGDQPAGRLLMGSWNWTKLQEYFDPSFVIETTEPEIVKEYYREFLRLQSGKSGPKKFSDRDYNPFAAKIQFIDSFAEIWWSPGLRENSIQRRILDLIASATETIRVMGWQITDREIADKLVEKARAGVKVTILTDDYNFLRDYSVFPFLLDELSTTPRLPLEIVDDSARTHDFLHQISAEQHINFNSFLHHHTLIVDNRTVLFGTNNWSQQAAFNNDESVIITNNEKIVGEFLQSFESNYRQLRQEPLALSINNGVIEFKDPERYAGQRLVVSNLTKLNPSSVICQSVKNLPLAGNITLDEKCDSPYLDFYILDNDGTVLSNILIRRAGTK